MSSKRIDESSQLPVALTGLSLAVGIAREATDAFPIVKQTLGAAVRIVALAERMDKDREALHALADKSLQLAKRVKDVTAGRTPDSNIASSLERIVQAFDSIEKFMMKHVARSRLRRAIGYAFTIPQHIERLSRDLADAVQELVVVALLEVDHQLNVTHAAVEDNARFAGEFRLIRHCEVEKLDFIREQACYGPERTAIVRYHRACVDGQLLVVRYLEGGVPQDTHSTHQPSGAEYDSVLIHDRILEEVSTIQMSHPNVARIYGRGKGSIHDRFTVLKSGYRPVQSLIDEVTDPTEILVHCVFKLISAVLHLRALGITWRPEHTMTFVEPNSDSPNKLYNRIEWAAWPITHRGPLRKVASADVQAAVANCHNERLNSLLTRAERFDNNRIVLPKAEFSHRHILNDCTATVLLQEVERAPLQFQCRDLWTWPEMLLALDKNRGHRLKVGVEVVYYAFTNGSDRLDVVTVQGIDEDSERIVYDRFFVDIPKSQRDEIRDILGIPAPFGVYNTHMIASSGPGTYRAPI